MLLRLILLFELIFIIFIVLFGLIVVVRITVFESVVIVEAAVVVVGAAVFCCWDCLIGLRCLTGMAHIAKWTPYRIFDYISLD